VYSVLAVNRYARRGRSAVDNGMGKTAVGQR
jgi:hypothetical protein